MMKEVCQLWNDRAAACNIITRAASQGVRFEADFFEEYVSGPSGLGAVFKGRIILIGIETNTYQKKQVVDEDMLPVVVRDESGKGYTYKDIDAKIKEFKRPVNPKIHTTVIGGLMR